MKKRDSSLHNRFSLKSRIKVLGLGGAGGNTINRLSMLRIPGITLIAANTDAQALRACGADKKIPLGADLTRGLGSGGDPQIGRKAAEESYRDLIDCIKGADLLFLTAGMGGGTGSGAIEIAARVARSLNVLTIAVVTMPFSFESGLRAQNARETTARLRPFTDTLITIPNDRLMSLTSRETSLSTAFAMADDLLIKAIQGLSSLIQPSGLINVDFSHILRLLRQEGGCYISSGVGSGADKAIEAVQSSLCHPLLEDISLQDAGGLIIKFSGDLSLEELHEAMEFLRSQTSENAEIITAVSEDNLLAGADKVQAMLLVTGIGAVALDDVPISELKELKPEPEIHDMAIPISGDFPQIGFTPADPTPDELEVPAFLRRGYNQVQRSLR